MAVSPFFLGVERSLTGRPWRSRLDAAGEARALAIAQVSGQNELMARVLAGRGVGLDEVARHLEPTLRELMPDPFALRDMEAATARLARAVRARRARRDLRRLRRRRRGERGAAERISRGLRLPETLDPYSRSRRRGLRPEQRGDGRLRRGRREPRRHRRLRRGQPRADRRGAAARPRRRRVRSSPGAGKPARRARRRRSRTGRTISPASAISAPPGSSTWASSRSIARCARRASFTAARRPISWPRSISSRWRRSPTSCRWSASTGPS